MNGKSERVMKKEETRDEKENEERGGWDFSHFIFPFSLVSWLSFMRMLIRMLRWEMRQVSSSPLSWYLWCTLLSQLPIVMIKIQTSACEQMRAKLYKDVFLYSYLPCKHIKNILLSNHNSSLTFTLDHYITLDLHCSEFFDFILLIFRHQVGERMK